MFTFALFCGLLATTGSVLQHNEWPEVSSEQYFDGKLNPWCQWPSHCQQYFGEEWPFNSQPNFGFDGQWYPQQDSVDQWYQQQNFGDQWYPQQDSVDQWDPQQYSGFGDQWYPQQDFGNQWYPQQDFGNQWYPQQDFGDQWYPQQDFGDQWYQQQNFGDQWYQQQNFGDLWIPSSTFAMSGHPTNNKTLVTSGIRIRSITLSDGFVWMQLNTHHQTVYIFIYKSNKSNAHIKRNKRSYVQSMRLTNTTIHPLPLTPTQQLANIFAGLLVLALVLWIFYHCFKSISSSRQPVEYIVSTRASAYI